MDFSLKTSFTACVIGSSKSGKSFLIENLLRNAHFMYDRKPGKIMYCYKVYDEKFNDMKDIVDVFHKGIPSAEKLEEFSLVTTNGTIVIDDLAEELTKDFSQFFTVYSHHFDFNLYFVTHEIFHKNPAFRTIALNCSYFILFRTPRDMVSISTLLRQHSPEHWRALKEAYNEATSEPYSYFFIDFQATTPEWKRYRSNIIFENNKPMKLYIVH